MIACHFYLPLLLFITTFVFATVHGWSFQCNDNGYCTRVLSTDLPAYSSLEMCKLVCGKNDYLNIWPYPTGDIVSEKNIILINPENIKFELEGTTASKTFLHDVIKYFWHHFQNHKSYNCENSSNMIIFLNSLSDDLSLTIDTDEYYSLTTSSSGDGFKVEIIGNTVFGVRHGIETLLQLLVPDEKGNATCMTTLKKVQLDDKPVYRHRGLLLDSARNYLSVNTIKKNIDAMAASKMNVLHWHITDSQSFPLEIANLPNMTKYGAYDATSIYTQQDVKELVMYGKIRGIRILLEIDSPSHAGNGWQWGEEAGLGNLAVCVNKQPYRSFCIQPPCGQLNPVNSNVYKVLQQLYTDLIQMAPHNGLFHMGGDEVWIPCWNSTPEIIDYLKEKPLTEETFLDLWGEFQGKALAAFDAAIGNNKTSIVIWTSHLTEPTVITKYLPKERYIIQTWVPDSEQDLITSLLKLGYKLIISTKDKWYLDHGFWGTTQYYDWRTVYNNKIYNQFHKSILGGEVCMWGELVDDSNIESRVWPRAAAAAERLWSNPKTLTEAAPGRFFSQRARLTKRGLKTEAEIPQWCIQNEGECRSYLDISR